MVWQLCATREKVKEGAMLVVQVGDQSVVLFELDGAVHATSNLCTHEDAWLSEGYLEGDCIECPLHAALYHIPSGEVRGGPPGILPLRTFPTRIEGENVFIDVD